MKKTLNVYFNRCFTDTSEVINEIKKNKDNIEYKIFISHPVQNERLEASADYYELEPSIEDIIEYKNYCLNFCIEHNIDVFVPRYRAQELVTFKNDFVCQNIKVLFVGDNNTYNILNDKGKVYSKYKNSEIIRIPPFKVITNYDEFIDGYKYIKESGFDVCIKPVTGIGAVGFKVIKENLTPQEELFSSSYKIALYHLKELLKNAGQITPMLLSGILPDDELSVDCLADNGKLIEAVTRVKSSRFVQTVKIDKELNEKVKIITKDFNLNNLYNVQFKLKGHDIYLLEINTRMSAGIFKSCRIGINFLHKAIMKEFGQEIYSEMEKTHDINVITVENTTVLKI